MQRKWRWAMMIVVVLAVVAGPLAGGNGAVQAGGSWSAWVYESESGRLVHVFPDGAPATEMAFPLPPGTSTPPNSIAISRDGALLAACLIDDAGNHSVRAYDIYNGVYIAAYIPPSPLTGCSLTRWSFSPDGTQLAFGILNHYPYESDPRPDWELIVMQMHTSSIVHHITSDSPSVVSLGQDLAGRLPFVSAFETGVIALKPVAWGTEGWCEYESLVWQLDGSNVVSVIGPYGKSGLDFNIPNGEAIWSDTDAAFPSGTLEGPGCLHNVVMFSNKTGAQYPIFNNGTVLWGSTFVDDGRKVAVNSYTAGGSQWLYLDRAGNTYILPSDVAGPVWGTPDGYVFIGEGPFGVPEVRHHSFDGAVTPTVSVLWNGLSDEYWRIIWVNPLTGGGGLTPFPPLAVLGPPPVMPTATAYPTVPPAGSPGVLTVGGSALVQTTEGDMLRVRSGPGLGYDISFQLANGSLVTIAEGPISANGYVWWRVVNSGGSSGWAVESVTDNGVFLQTLIPTP